jgi:hypothetical protein
MNGKIQSKVHHCIKVYQYYMTSRAILESILFCVSMVIFRSVVILILTMMRTMVLFSTISPVFNFKSEI